MTFSHRRFMYRLKRVLPVCLVSALLLSGTQLAAQGPNAQSAATRVRGLKVGRFPLDVHSEYGVHDGLPSDDVRAIAALPSGAVYAGTKKGLSRLQDGRWTAVSGISGPVVALASMSNGLWAATADALDHVRGNSVDQKFPLPDGVHECISLQALDDGRIVLAAREAIFRGGPAALK